MHNLLSKLHLPNSSEMKLLILLNIHLIHSRNEFTKPTKSNFSCTKHKLLYVVFMSGCETHMHTCPQVIRLQHYDMNSSNLNVVYVNIKKKLFLINILVGT